MKVYVTKYALTQGVQLCSISDHVTGGGDYDYVRFRGKYGIFDLQCLRGRDSHKTREEAIERVKQMVWARRRSLSKSLAQLDKVDLHAMFEAAEKAK